MSGGILILGAGQAAAQLAISLRQGGHDGPIRMIGDEPFAPYQRPPLSKAYLKEKASIETLLLRRDSYWADHKVELCLGAPAAAVDPGRRQVSLGDGRSFDYDTLVFATGTRARDLAVARHQARRGVLAPQDRRRPKASPGAWTMPAASSSSAAAISGSRWPPCCARRAATPSSSRRKAAS